MTMGGGTATVARRAVPRLELVESKLRPPQAPAGTVARTRLIQRLEGPPVRPVTILSAAPGYGKTTVLTQWQKQSRRPVAWVTLDDHDNDPIVLLSYVATALDRVSPLDPAVFDALASAGASIEAKVVPALGSALAGAEQPFVLTLDDLHAVTNPSCLDAIDALIDHVPGGSQLALAGRGELRMDDGEAAELLRGAEMELADTEVARLVELTEGWPAGLYLATLAGVAAVEEATPFRGDDRFVAEYLRSELLSRLPQGELRFLTRTSVLDRMCGALCDAVLESAGSAEMLESLRRSNRFVTALDRTREWYRYHHLFRDLLRDELERAEPELVPQLHGRASEWCEASAEPEAAVAYAQAADDVDRVAGLVLVHTRIQYERGRAVTVERWMEWLERNGGLERHPALAALGAWASALGGNSAAAERWSAMAERAVDGDGSANGDSFVHAWLATLGAARCLHGPERMRADAETAAQGFGRDSPFWPTAAVLLGIAHRLGGEDERAEDLFGDAVESARHAEAWPSVTVALGERAALIVDRKDWREAEALTEEADAIVRRARLEGYPANAIVNAASARVAIHRGERARADEHLARAQRLRPRLTHALGAFSIHTRLELARAYAALADAAGARTLLREAGALMRRGSGYGTLTKVADDLRANLESVTVTAPGASSLTAAELRLLPLLTTHLSFREIGERLYISRHTVKSHAMSIYRKLDVSSRTDAVERAREVGLLSS